MYGDLNNAGFLGVVSESDELIAISKLGSPIGNVFGQNVIVNVDFGNGRILPLLLRARLRRVGVVQANVLFMCLFGCDFVICFVSELSSQSAATRNISTGGWEIWSEWNKTHHPISAINRRLIFEQFLLFRRQISQPLCLVLFQLNSFGVKCQNK